MQVFRVEVSKNKDLSLLCNLAQPVVDLFYRGPFLELLRLPRVAIVGSRKATAYGRIVTTQLATELARAGVVVVSGLALGIDSIAHQACLDAGGKTIAVLPGSIQNVYPAQHRYIAEEIVKNGGALITEYPDTPRLPMKYQFIARNRIIAGLSRAVIITEAAEKSGSLHTANFALEQGIEVLAVPGNITNGSSSGANQLIKSGAQPVTKPSDILEILSIKPRPEDAQQSCSPEESLILTALQAGPLPVSELSKACQLSTGSLLQTLTLLELRGRVRNIENSSWIRL